MSDISLSGGEISLVKTIGLGGGSVAGSQLADRMEEMESAEFLDTLGGLMSRDYVLASKVNIRTMDAVRSATFRVNPTHARDLKEGLYPSRKKEEKGRRRRRS